MVDAATGFWADLVGRLSGPLAFRFILQPAMATLYAIRDGLKDAREGRPAYFWTILSEPGEVRSLLNEGWKAVARVIALGAVMDAVYQLIVFKWIYPVQLLVIVLLLAFLPYLLLRGPVKRIAEWWARTGKVRVR